MAGPRTSTSARRNGHERAPIEPPGPPPSDSPPPDSLLSRAWRERAGAVQRRTPRAALDERDPDFIREQLPLFWLFSSVWFRGEVRRLGNIPDEGPVLLV